MAGRKTNLENEQGDMRSLHDKVDRIIQAMATREDIHELILRADAHDEKFDRLVTALDATSKSYDTLRLEYAAIKLQLSRYERWFDQVAKKTGIQLEV